MIENLRTAAEALDNVDLYQPTLKLDELYEMGDLMQVIIDRLCVTASSRLPRDIAALRNEPIYDNSQADATFAADGVVNPQDRLTRALEGIGGLRIYLMRAYQSAADYHSAIGHIGIRSES